MYFLQLAKEPERFDMVTEFVFDNAAKCVVLNGEEKTPRYGKGRVAYVNGEVTIQGTFSDAGFARIFRMLGITASQGTAGHERGVYDTPDTVVLVERGHVFRYDLSDGSKWRKAA